MSTSRSHVILGGNGPVGRETALALLRRGTTPTVVARRPSTVDGTTSVTGDLLSRDDTVRATADAEVAYLTIGVPYSSRVWAEQWPVVIDNTIAACVASGTRLVFLDNVYLYGPVHGSMTETTPINPTTRKGRTRALLVRRLEEAARDHGLVYSIARSADFYGPGASTSVFNNFALDRISAGKKATWLFNADLPHSMTYTPDIGEAMAILGTIPSDAGGVWHVPTAPPLTGREYVRVAAGDDAETNVMGMATMRIGAPFNAAAREVLELSYQNTQPYVFDSRAFEEQFSMAATPIAAGIAASLSPRR
jgi:nucleoside-diphosphate-sugar epimerase